MNAGKLGTLLVHGLLGWGLCAAVMGIGRALLPLEDALLLHVFAAPVSFVFVSRNYFRKFAYTTPLQTAFVFLAVVLLADFFIVVPMITHSLEMFASVLGVWGPVVLMFTATHVTGLLTMNGIRSQVLAP
jgi:hypothetical protein